MAYLLITITILAVVHFVVETTLLPSYRLKTRFQAFALRDELRNLKMTSPLDLSGKEYNFLQESINVTVEFLSFFNIKSAIDSYTFFKKNPGISKEADCRQKVIYECANEQYQSIRKRTLRLARETFLANSAMLILYLFPFMLAIVIVAFFVKKLNDCTTLIHNIVYRAMSMPENDMPRMKGSLSF